MVKYIYIYFFLIGRVGDVKGKLIYVSAACISLCEAKQKNMMRARRYHPTPNEG